MHVLSTYMIILATPKLACIMLNTPLYRPREAAYCAFSLSQLKLTVPSGRELEV